MGSEATAIPRTTVTYLELIRRSSQDDSPDSTLSGIHTHSIERDTIIQPAQVSGSGLSRLVADSEPHQRTLEDLRISFPGKISPDYFELLTGIRLETAQGIASSLASLGPKVSVARSRYNVDSLIEDALDAEPQMDD